MFQSLSVVSLGDKYIESTKKIAFSIWVLDLNHWDFI